MDEKTICPIEFLKHYIDCFESKEASRNYIDLLLDTALSSSDADIWTASERSDLIFFCRQTQQLIDNIFIIGFPLFELFTKCKKAPNEKV